jgi:hypothetical protein
MDIGDKAVYCSFDGDIAEVIITKKTKRVTPQISKFGEDKNVAHIGSVLLDLSFQTRYQVTSCLPIREP